MTQGPDFTNPTVTQRRAAYDTDNMPTQVWAQQSGVTTYFSYDGDGDRVKKTTSGGATIYYVGDHYEVKNNESLKYIFAGNLRLIMIKGTNTFYYHKDHLNSTSVMTDNSGTVVETAQYEPFGATRDHTGQDMSAYKFTDQELDNETNLYNYDARLYDPVIGRFVTPDPYFSANLSAHIYYNKLIEGNPNISKFPGSFKANEFALYFSNPQRLNKYSYCLNNPLIYTDPFGLFESPWYFMWIPGQHLFDLGMTSVENGNYGFAGIYFVSALGEQIVTVLTFGQGAAIRGGGTAFEVGATSAASKSLSPLRQQYVDAVESLTDSVPAMRNAGMRSEEIARALHAERRALGEQFKALTPPDKLAEIYARNLKLYGDKLGPSIDWLRNVANKSWEQIIESATRTGGKDLGL